MSSKKSSASNGRGIYTAPILVGLTPEQHESVKNTAKKAQRSVGEWARIVLTDASSGITSPENECVLAYEEALRAIAFDDVRGEPLDAIARMRKRADDALSSTRDRLWKQIRENVKHVVTIENKHERPIKP